MTIIDNDELKMSILSALADKEMLKILNLSMYSSKSVNDILRESDISYTTVYRKIKWLLDKELLVVDKINISPEGKKYTTFRSVLKSVVIRYKQNEIIVEAEKNVDLRNISKRNPKHKPEQIRICVSAQISVKKWKFHTRYLDINTIDVFRFRLWNLYTVNICVSRAYTLFNDYLVYPRFLYGNGNSRLEFR